MRKTAITPLLIHQSGTNYTQEYTASPLPSEEERKKYENLIKITSFYREHKNCFVLPNRIVKYFNKIRYLIEFNITPNKLRNPILEAYDNRKTHITCQNILVSKFTFPTAGLSYWPGRRWRIANGHQIWWLAANKGKPK